MIMPGVQNRIAGHGVRGTPPASDGAARVGGKTPDGLDLMPVGHDRQRGTGI